MKGSETKKFKRILNTNYKYSCLITLSMNLLRQHNLYEESSLLAKNCGIKDQKNYGIVVLRLSYFIHKLSMAKNGKKHAIQQIINYFSLHVDECLESKYNIFTPQRKNQYVQTIRSKFFVDLKILQKVFLSPTEDLNQVAYIFTELYQVENGRPSIKQTKEAIKLAKILVGVINLGEKYKGSSQNGNSQISSGHKNKRESQEFESQNVDELEDDLIYNSEELGERPKQQIEKKQQLRLQSQKQLVIKDYDLSQFEFFLDYPNIHSSPNQKSIWKQSFYSSQMIEVIQQGEYEKRRTNNCQDFLL